MKRASREPESRIRRVALGVSLLLNLVFVVMAYFGALPHRRPAADRADRPMIVRLIDRAVEAPSPNPSQPATLAPEIALPLPPIARRVSPLSRRPQAPREEASEPQSQTLHLFDATGRVMLPQSIATDTPRSPSNDALAHRNDVPYASTRFERAWTPRDETLGEALVRETTISHTWSTPWGTEIHCVATLVMALIGGCGWGYAPTAPIEELQRMRADPPMPRSPDKEARISRARM